METDMYTHVPSWQEVQYISKEMAQHEHSSRFTSQHPHGKSQLTITLVQGDLTPTSHLHGTRHARGTCRQNTDAHEI